MIINTRTQTIGTADEYTIIQGILNKNESTNEIDILLSVLNMNKEGSIDAIKQKMSYADLKNLSMTIYYLQSDYEQTRKNKEDNGQAAG